MTEARFEALRRMHWPNGRPRIMTLADAYVAAYHVAHLVTFRGQRPVGFTRIEQIDRVGEHYLVEFGADHETTIHKTTEVMNGDAIVITR